MFITSTDVICPKCAALAGTACRPADTLVKVGGERLTKCHRERALLVRRIERIHELLGQLGVSVTEDWPERSEIEFFEECGDDHDREVAIELLSLLDDTKYDGGLWEMATS